MLECHNLPTAETYSATYYTFLSNSRSAGTTINNVVMYDKNTMLQSGVFGVIRYCQISTNTVTTVKHNDEITINNISYKLINPTRCANPAFVTFWESELKRL